jgi:PhnB protein
MMHVYVKNSGQALKFYQKAFDAELLCSYPDTGEPLSHGELNIHGQVLALAELSGESAVTGNTMQFCFELGEGKEAVVQKIYDVLKDGAKIIYPLGPVDFSPLLADLIDRYGVRWCIFV